MRILTLCTANVARSVMLAYMLSALAEAEGRDWQVRSAGIYAIEGDGVSARTRRALEGLGELGERSYAAHRSHQVRAADVEWADVVLAMEADQVRFLQGLDDHLGARAVSFAQFVRHAPLDEPLSHQIATVRAVGLSDDDDVTDPRDGDEATYVRCAQELWELAQAFAVVASDD